MRKGQNGRISGQSFSDRKAQKMKKQEEDDAERMQTPKR